MTYYALLVSITLGTSPNYTQLSEWSTRAACEHLAEISKAELLRWSPDLDIRWDCVERKERP